MIKLIISKSVVNFRMLHRLESLYHSKIRKIGNESEGGVVIMQGMTEWLDKDSVLFQSRQGVLHRNPYFSLLGIVDFLGMSQFLMILGALVGNHGLQVREILLDSLISRISVECTFTRNKLGKDRLFKKLVIMHSAGDRRTDMEDMPALGRCNLGFYGESLLFT